MSFFDYLGLGFLAAMLSLVLYLLEWKLLKCLGAVAIMTFVVWTFHTGEKNHTDVWLAPLVFGLVTLFIYAALALVFQGFASTADENGASIYEGF
jgi:hypothetical protein